MTTRPVRLTLLLTREEAAKFQAAAAVATLPVSTWVRTIVLEKLKQEKQKESTR